MQRDQVNQKLLKEAGYTVMRIGTMVLQISCPNA